MKFISKLLLTLVKTLIKKQKSIDSFGKKMNLGLVNIFLSTEREWKKMSGKYCVCDVCFFTAAVAGHERQQQNLVVAWEQQQQLKAVAVGAPPHQQQLASVV